MKNNHWLLLSFAALLILGLTSCSSVGLLSDNNSWIPEEIEDLGDFFKVYLVLQLSIIIIGVLLGFLLGNGGYIVSLILHFIWIVSYRDYGFLRVMFLFGLFTIISFLISSINIFRKKEH